MKELKFEIDNHINNILIQKNNNIIYKDKMKILEFYSVLQEGINKNKDVFISNNKLNNKEYFLINLMDITSIIENIKYNKGSLLYEYINLIVNNKEEYLNKIENIVDNLMHDINSSVDFDISWEFNNSLSKILTSLTDINVNIKIKELNTIVNNLLDCVVKYNSNKIYIIFIDKGLININLNNDNLYIFNINSNVENINDYNLLFLDNYYEFNLNVLLDNIKLNWNKEYNDNYILYLLKDFINIYLKYDNIFISNNDIKQLKNIFYKLYNIQNNSNSIEIL